MTGRCSVCGQTVPGRVCQSHKSPWYPYDPLPCTIHNGLIALHKHANTMMPPDLFGSRDQCIGSGMLVHPVTTVLQ